MDLFEREIAQKFLSEHVKTKQLLKHSYAVEGAMLYYGKLLGADYKKWGTVGLLHDIDFEKYPETHPFECVSWFKEKGYDSEFISAVLGHASKESLRENIMAKTLFAVDELASFIVAVALMRPTKFEGLSVKSVKKKLKAKSFAAAVNRQTILSGAQEINLELSEHIQNVINGLIEHEEYLKEFKFSLIE